MPEGKLDQVLFDAAAEVLETMFFTSTLGDAEPTGAAAADWLSAALSFRGGLRGRLRVRVPRHTARGLAAGFLGVEEAAVTAAQVGQVVCELANMLCGSVLSRLEEGALFELDSPALEPPGSALLFDCKTARRDLELAEGALGLSLELEPDR